MHDAELFNDPISRGPITFTFNGRGVRGWLPQYAQRTERLRRTADGPHASTPSFYLGPCGPREGPWQLSPFPNPRSHLRSLTDPSPEQGVEFDVPDSKDGDRRPRPSTDRRNVGSIIANNSHSKGAPEVTAVDGTWFGPRVPSMGGRQRMNVGGMASDPPELTTVKTGVPGLDAVLAGGLIAGSVCLIAGPAGSGKTTLGNQVAFSHAGQGGRAVFVTVLAETHERMLSRLRGFRFFNPDLIGRHLYYVSLLEDLEQGGLDGLLTAIREVVRDQRATLLVIDGGTLIEDLAPSSVEFRRFLQHLQTATAMMGCTTLLLSGHGPTTIGTVGMHTDGIVLLGLEPTGERDRRTIRVVKLRGAEHLTGRHDLSLGAPGMEVYPRLEALGGPDRPVIESIERLGTGISALDEMLGGGLLRATSTMVLGTPGVGKTLCGLHFIDDGLTHGEPALVATFHENAGLLRQTAANISLDLASPADEGRLRVLWRAPLELSPDAWAWQLFDEVERHQPQRLFLDGLSDIQRLILTPDRVSMFITALTNELRDRGVTTMMTVEIDGFAGADLMVPVPSVSATMDNGILMRHVELGSRVHRLISVLKARQSAAHAEIREFVVGSRGIEVGGIFGGASALLTGTASMETNATPPVESGTVLA
jgi:circadian clock protein KaiC